MRVFLMLIGLYFFNHQNQAVAQKSNINGFTLYGKIDTPLKGVIFLFYKNDSGLTVRDSSLIHNGEFYFQGEINCYSGIVSLQLNGTDFSDYEDNNAAPINIENSVMRIEIKYNNFKNFKLTGCISYDLYKKYVKNLDNEINYYNKLIEKTSSSFLKDSFSNLIQSKIKAFAQKNIKFILLNPNLNITPRLIYEFSNSYDTEQLLMLFNNISEKQKHSFYGIRLNLIVDELLSIRNQIGTVAPIINAFDVNGIKLSLDSMFKNNYVLLDFWASWCKPCRASNPNLKTIYKAYSNKGFEIIGVADNDDDIIGWKNAIAHDSIGVWKHILRGRKKEVDMSIKDINKLYHVSSIPIKILINKNGIIIGRYDSSIGEDVLNNKLKELFEE